MKVTKEIANYEEPSCSGDTCGNCIYFQELEVHHCARVEGIIKPDAICKLFEPAFTLRGWKQITTVRRGETHIPAKSKAQFRFIKEHPEKFGPEWTSGVPYSRLPSHILDGHSNKKNHNKPKKGEK